MKPRSDLLRSRTSGLLCEVDLLFHGLSLRLMVPWANLSNKVTEVRASRMVKRRLRVERKDVGLLDIRDEIAAARDFPGCLYLACQQLQAHSEREALCAVDHAAREKLRG